MAAGLGSAVVEYLVPRAPAATRLALAFLVGAAALSYCTLALGLVGRLRASDLIIVLAVLSVPAVLRRRPLASDCRATARDIGDEWRRADRLVRVLMALAGLVVASSVVMPFLPVTNADALAYATAVPARYAETGRIAFYADSYESAFALLNETLHAIGYALHVRPVGVWFEVAAQALLVGAAADCYRAYWGDERRGAAFLFSAALLAMPLLGLMPFMTKAHLMELLGIIVALTIVLNAPEKGGWTGAAACLGVVAATKYNAALGAVPLLAPAVVAGLWRSRWHGWRVRDLAAAVVACAVVALPFYVRNAAWTGNPVFPMPLPGLVSAFALEHHTAWIHSLYELDSGLGRRPIDLLLWWPRAALDPARGLASYMGIFGLAFLPLAWLRPRARHVGVVAAGFGLSTVVVFLLGTQFERYFIAAVGAMTLLATAGWDARRPTSRVIRWGGAAVLVATGAGITLPLKAYGLAVHAPSLWSRDGERRVLAATTPWYQDYVRVREEVDRREPILCLLRNCQYLDNSLREDLLFRLAERARTADGAFDPRPVWQGLGRAGVRYVMSYEPDGLSGDPAPTAVGWLARCAGRIVYRNPAARFGTRDPQRASSSVLVLIEIGDRLTDEGAALTGGCAAPRRVW